MTSSERIEIVVNHMMERSLEVLYNSYETLRFLQEERSRRLGERLALAYCRMNGLPAIGYEELLQAITTAMKRRSLTLDQDIDQPRKVITPTDQIGYWKN